MSLTIPLWHISYFLMNNTQREVKRARRNILTGAPKTHKHERGEL